MAEDVTPRFGRPSWRDPRLGVGVLLVAGAVALGGWAVSQAAQTVEVFVAPAALTPGDVVHESELRVQEVRPDGVQDVYLPAAEGLPEDSVVVRLVGAGELVPRAALGDAQQVDLRPVVVPLDAAVPEGVGKGSRVDLWLTEPAPSAVGAEPVARPEPALLAGGLIVAGLAESDSIFAGAGGTGVQVLVPQDRLPAVLTAVSGEGVVVLVPVPGGGT